MSARSATAAAATAAGSAWRDEAALLPGGQRRVLRVYGGSAATSALVLHFHAGVFVEGGLDDGAAVAEALRGAGATVVSLDYPLAPAHPFPAAADCGYAALQWLQRQRRRLAAAQIPLYIAGEEAGGNLAAAVAMMARDRCGPGLAGQILLSPMLDACLGSASQRDARVGAAGCPCADGWRAYLARDADALHPYAAPGRSLRLAGLPPTLLMTAADDPLRDETAAFGERLRGAGVPVQLQRVAAPTGWPASYRQPPHECAWQPDLRAALQSLIR
jgi:acetyl esterase